MTTIIRRDPRRAFVLTRSGVRRIALIPDAAPAASAGSASVLVPDAAPRAPLRTTLPAVHHLLVLVRADAGALSAQARQCIAAAALIATDDTAVAVGVLGAVHEDLARYGADILVRLDGGTGELRPEQELAQVGALLERFRPLHLLMPEGAALGDLGRRLAVQQRCSIGTHVVELTAAHAARYLPGSTSGQRHLEVCSPLPDIILLETDAADSRLPFIGRGDEAAWQEPAALASQYRSRGVTRLDSAALRLEEADVIAAAGNGVTDVALFTRLARALGAATGASRVAVDDGRFSRDRQIGATGTTVTANLYLAIGISGAVQHLQGIKDCRHVIAINTDAGAPMIQRADLSVIGDAHRVMAALLAQLSSELNEDAA